MVSLGLDDAYAVERMRPLVLHPEFEGKAYRWLMARDGDSLQLVAASRDYVFCAADTGIYRIRLNIDDVDNPLVFDCSVRVWEEQVAYSPFITRVLEYRPAPGQFVNILPEYSEGDTYDDMLAKVQDCLADNHREAVSLGAYGGYVTFAFDHSVVNTPNAYDFCILGNAFASALPTGGMGGNCEPGIVLVSFDANENDLPDDPWYELAGSEYNNPSTRHNYTLTYRMEQFSDTILWTDNGGDQGYLSRNLYHTQSYWPKWISDSILTFSGTLLPPNAVDLSGNGTNYMFYAYPFGYTDSYPNDSVNLNSFDINWAVSANGQHVQLSCIDFVRVYTAVNQTCGWVGETSTEVSGAIDLHLMDK